jgi:hypothetical protein
VDAARRAPACAPRGGRGPPLLEEPEAHDEPALAAVERRACLLRGLLRLRAAGADEGVVAADHRAHRGGRLEAAELGRAQERA